MNNTVLKDRLNQAMSSANKNTSLISTDEAARMCGLSTNQFTTARTQRWPDVLKPAKRDGNRKFYRVCDVDDFIEIMKKKKPLRYANNSKKEEPVESNATIASLIKSKVRIEKDILVLQEAHQHLCRAIQHLRK